MKIEKKAAAGTMESNDVFIVVEPCEKGVTIDLSSPVEKQYGPQIIETIRQVLSELDIDGACITAVDRGALDCTLRARTQTAVSRALRGDAQ